MGETFKYVSSVSGAMGYSIEDTAVAIGLLANAGIKGTQAGTSLRSIMSRLVAPTKESEVAIEKLGLSITDTEGNMRPFNEVLVEIREKMGGLSEEQQGLIAKQLAGQEAMTGLLTIVNASEEDFNSLTEAVNNSAGASKRMAKTMMDNLSGNFTILKSTVEGIAISFGEVLAPMINKGLEKIQGLAEWVLNLGDRQKKLLITIPTLVAGIGTRAIAGTKVITTVSAMRKAFASAKLLMVATNSATTTLITSQNLLNREIMGLKSPVGITVAILGALTLAFKDVDGVGTVLKATLTGVVAGVSFNYRYYYSISWANSSYEYCHSKHNSFKYCFIIKSHWTNSCRNCSFNCWIVCSC